MSKHTLLYSWTKVPHQVFKLDLGNKSDEDMRRAAEFQDFHIVQGWRWTVFGPTTGVLLKNSKASLCKVILPVCTTQEEATAMAEAGEVLE